MKQSLLSNLAALLTAAMGAMIAVPPERLGVKTPFGPCVTEPELIDIGFMPQLVLPYGDAHYDLTNPCFANV
jgi:hypothetical protein